MDINQKKTALDDDSILYQKRDDSIGKKDISGLSGRQRLQYFRDYYLKFCILAIALLVVAVSLHLYHLLPSSGDGAEHCCDQ